MATPCTEPLWPKKSLTFWPLVASQRRTAVSLVLAALVPVVRQVHLLARLGGLGQVALGQFLEGGVGALGEQGQRLVVVALDEGVVLAGLQGGLVVLAHLVQQRLDRLIRLLRVL